MGVERRGRQLALRLEPACLHTQLEFGRVIVLLLCDVEGNPLLIWLLVLLLLLTSDPT